MATQRPVEVHVEIDGAQCQVGQLFFHSRRQVQRSTFQYEVDFLRQSDAYAIDSILPLAAGPFQSTDETFSAFADAAPDRWGRMLMERRERRRAELEGRAKREVMESDFILGVSDLTRQGALRFKYRGDEHFSAEPAGAVPTLVSLPDLLHAADRVTDDDDTALKLLLDAGSASLGGARPKTAVRGDSGLLLAKFPHRSDEWDVMAWEKTALDLAERAGIETPARRLEKIGERHALLIRRFDRDAGRRIGYMSGRTLLESPAGDSADYSDVAEALELTTTEATLDLQGLWRRILFSVFINNTDDHLRNHGLIRKGRGWRLSPVFDVNPTPDTAKGRATTILGESRGAAQLDALKDLGEQFRLSPSERERIVGEVREAARQWPDVARSNGLSDRECKKMAGAFELATRAV